MEAPASDATTVGYFIKMPKPKKKSVPQLPKRQGPGQPDSDYRIIQGRLLIPLVRKLGASSRSEAVKIFQTLPPEKQSEIISSLKAKKRTFGNLKKFTIKPAAKFSRFKLRQNRK